MMALRDLSVSWYWMGDMGSSSFKLNELKLTLEFFLCNNNSLYD